jgi:hypothetical protein
MEAGGRIPARGQTTEDGGRRPADGSRRADGRRQTEAGGRILRDGFRSPGRDSDASTGTSAATASTSPRVARGFYAARGVLESRGKEKGKVLACAGEAAAQAETRDGKSLAARKYARRDRLDGNLAKFGKCFAKLLEHQFSSFAKKTRIASAIGKLLEML